MPDPAPLTWGDVPLLDPDTGKFPDAFAPPSVALDVEAAEAARDAAVLAKDDAESARDLAEGYRDAAAESADDAAGAASAALGVVLSDGFDRPDGPIGNFDNALGGGTPGAWDQVGGTGFVVDDKALAESSGASLTGLRTPILPDVDAEIIVTVKALASSGTFGLIARNSSAGLQDCYRLNIATDGALTLQARVSSSNSTIGSAEAGTVVAGDQVALRCMGHAIQALVNGVPVINVRNTAITVAGRAGVISLSSTDWRIAWVAVRRVAPSFLA